MACHRKTRKILNSPCSEMHNFQAVTMMSCLGYPRCVFTVHGAQGCQTLPTFSPGTGFSRCTASSKWLMTLNSPKKTKRAICGRWQHAVSSRRPPSGCMDEQIIPFTRVTMLKQYVPGKPINTGLKHFVLASTSGLIQDFDIYQGKSFMKVDNSPDRTGAKHHAALCKNAAYPNAAVF